MHKQYLLAALEQAWLGRGMCAPNPSVGAVAVQAGQIIAQAHHHGAGTPHAEQLLLAQLPPNLSDITLYVTLEPCNHWGKTPPCVNAIIDYGVKQVVYAYGDPNPIVAKNNTSLQLTSHAIAVMHYPLPEINRFYESYYHWSITRRPKVTVKIAQSFDGKIAGINKSRVVISNALCSEFTHIKRLHSDVILTSARTIEQDDPLLNVRQEGYQISKPIAIISNSGQIDPKAKVFTTAKHCHIYHDQNYAIDSPLPNCFYHPVPAENGKLDLKEVVSHLGNLGYHDVWVEAGASIFNTLHQAKISDKTYIYLVPTLLGGKALSAYQHHAIFNRPHAVSWREMGNNMIAIFEWKKSIS